MTGERKSMGKGGATFVDAKSRTTPLSTAHEPQWQRCTRAAGRQKKLKPGQNQRQRPGIYTIYLLHLAVHCALLRFAIGKSCPVALRVAFPLMSFLLSRCWAETRRRHATTSEGVAFR